MQMRDTMNLQYYFLLKGIRVAIMQTQVMCYNKFF